MTTVHHGAQLKALHQAAGLKASVVAAKLGITRQAVDHVYRESKLTLDTLSKYASIVGKRAEDVVSPQPSDEEARVSWQMLIAAAEAGLGPVVADGLRKLRACPAPDRPMLIASMDAFLSALSRR